VTSLGTRSEAGHFACANAPRTNKIDPDNAFGLNTPTDADKTAGI